MCVLHDLVPPTVWNASLNKWWRLKQSIQLVHVPLSSWHNGVSVIAGLDYSTGQLD